MCEKGGRRRGCRRRSGGGGGVWKRREGERGVEKEEGGWGRCTEKEGGRGVREGGELLRSGEDWVKARGNTNTGKSIDFPSYMTAISFCLLPTPSCPQTH